MYAESKAAEAWRRYGLSIPVDLRRLVTALGLEVITFPFRGRIKEVIIEGVIGVQSGLARPWFRWYVAHAMGHHLLHVGTSFYLDCWQWVNRAKAERQAEEFAARLLGGPNGWRSSASELGIPIDKLSLLRGLTPPFHGSWPHGGLHATGQLETVGDPGIGHVDAELSNTLPTESQT